MRNIGAMTDLSRAFTKSNFFTLLRFLLVGGLAGLVHIAGVVLFSTVWPVHPILANTFGFLMAFCFSSIGHMMFTFRVTEGRAQAVARWFVVSFSALLVSDGVLHVLAEVLHWYLPLVQAIAIAVIPCVSFLAGKLWAFQPAPKAELSGA